MQLLKIMKLKEESKNTLDLEEIQILAQLIDNMFILSDKLEDSYNKKNGEQFNKSKSEILDYQKKLIEMLK